MSDSMTALHMLVWIGARPEEISRLRIGDVDLDRMGIEISNESGALDAPMRKLKTKASVRGIPIHRVLHALVSGYIDYIPQVSNSELLFPSSEPKTEKGRYATPLGSD